MKGLQRSTVYKNGHQKQTPHFSNQTTELLLTHTTLTIFFSFLFFLPWIGERTFCEQIRYIY